MKNEQIEKELKCDREEFIYLFFSIKLERFLLTDIHTDRRNIFLSNISYCG